MPRYKSPLTARVKRVKLHEQESVHFVVNTDYIEDKVAIKHIKTFDAGKGKVKAKPVLPPPPTGAELKAMMDAFIAKKKQEFLPELPDEAKANYNPIKVMAPSRRVKNIKVIKSAAMPRWEMDAVIANAFAKETNRTR